MEQFGVLTLGSRLKRLSDYLFVQVQEIYGQCAVPISATYFPTLRLLQKVGGLSVIEIAEQLNISHPAVSKQTNKMIKEGLLIKKQDEQDQRRSSLHLSDVAINALMQAEPVLKELKWVIEKMTNVANTNFMDALDKLEQQAFDGSLSAKVLDRLQTYKIVPLQKEHGEAFFELNFAWLEKYFPNQIMDYDLSLLRSPQENIIEKGGCVWVAVCEQPNAVGGGAKVVGTIALLPSPKGNTAEILKLCVAEYFQEKGVAQALLSHLIHCTEQQGIGCLTLETAFCLSSAQSLYEKNGFVEKAMPKDSIYERSDVYMEKNLRSNT
ncbi:bifunctional helix-turn-helix transcriptional regulator/GNAT family N-acetyltransferase [Marinomonas sp. C2222]|uniref:Bifunctional helix-turn-helix transcriptional regulator/GNAT family N-acetyltransferase n=1 Tax=Marinomonas sargassi TaxID=2984494 RepID=A0ABT2YS27_9GAMM|nr:bifunctional helix-turn-helix transcriptional regulator/GNAT family N-acetyltransferase [Marinomonas sargassi]MCV2402694.1 bifunctional helix-turn-helix transcriptional regulator/GNAT family N-acetyltransferase [Marinomonas sargassi]